MKLDTVPTEYDLAPVKPYSTVRPRLFSCMSVLRIRIHRIHMFLGLLDPDPDPSVRGIDPDPTPDPDPSIIKQI